MDATTLSKAMGCSLSRAKQMVDGYNIAMRAANITNVNRAAMFAAQIGTESLGLRYMEEIASGAAYEGRKNLGNTQPGDGRRFKGSGPIQLTGRYNFTKFSKWAAQQGHISDPKLFVNRPELVRQNPTYGFLAASWYWTVAAPSLNRLSDAKDVRGATKAINGGYNGLSDRTARFNRALKLGKALLPSGSATASAKTYTKDDVKRMQGQVGVTQDGAWGPTTDVHAQAIRAFLRGGLTPTDAQRKIYMDVRAKRPEGKRTTAEFRKGIQWALGVTADGIWGKKTDAAFEAMRDQHKMSSVKDGLPEPKTASKPKPATTKKPTVKTPRLAVDGKLGPATYKALQKVVGVKQDGIFGVGSKKATQKWLKVTADGVFGRRSIRALQKKVGARQDGVWGSGTTRALQTWLNKNG